MRFFGGRNTPILGFDSLFWGLGILLLVLVMLLCMGYDLFLRTCYIRRVVFAFGGSIRKDLKDALFVDS